MNGTESVSDANASVDNVREQAIDLGEDSPASGSSIAERGRGEAARLATVCRDRRPPARKTGARTSSMESSERAQYRARV